MEFPVDCLHIINESTILVQSTQTLVIVEVSVDYISKIKKKIFRNRPSKISVSISNGCP